MKQGFHERRKHVRLLLSLPMQVQWANEKGMKFNENYESVNVSAGGVYYKSCEELPLQTDTTVTFDLPPDSVIDFGILRARGKVVRVEEANTEKKGIALKFVDELKFSTFYNN